MGLAAVLLHWSPNRFWRASTHEFSAAMKTYRRIFCAESESEKRRKFAIFKREVEAADKERRWRRDMERRLKKARTAGTPAETPQDARASPNRPTAPLRPKA